MTTFAPSSAKRRAISLPMPLAAPVIIATLLCSWVIWCFHWAGFGRKIRRHTEGACTDLGWHWGKPWVMREASFVRRTALVPSESASCFG